ncbi:MAG: AAA family ATPase [Deltaproteobacteria bacterium]|nr:AAA family ATPase [Deltaproteobacteria bacterium]
MSGVFKRIGVRHFKSLVDVRLPLGPFTLIVGANATGKSNIRDALRVLHGIGRLLLGGDHSADATALAVLQWRPIRGGAAEAKHLWKRQLHGRGQARISQGRPLLWRKCHDFRPAHRSSHLHRTCLLLWRRSVFVSPRRTLASTTGAPKRSGAGSSLFW